MANAVEAAGSNGCEGGGSAGAGGGGRPPRLPRWTRQEILVLIEGKRVVESRGRGRAATGRPAAALVGAGSPVEPKWAAVSAYCRRHGVNRGPVQCRKRWSNLAGDFKKIKEWESGRAAAEKKGGWESFWAMRNDLRRERRLPGFFDREVYDILDGAAAAAEPPEEAEEEEEEGKGGAGKRGVADEEAVFDSGRAAAEDGLFSDFEEEKEVEEDEEPAEEEERPAAPPPPPPPAPVAAVVPISEKKYEPSRAESSDQGIAKDKQPADNLENESPSQEGQKRRRTSQDRAGDINLQSQLIEVLERNSRMLTAQLEAQNVNCQLDRDQRKDQTNSLLSVLGKLADALGRIADKL
ncbi:trihelix transcription factor ASR3 [Phoenix dactylifera]|uniref:Trihelix transcription factor ASR3 n=1 Tax=Phoenix dactylifera TaxID=42345 RepID=A0A8B7C3M6_PHODC|nr:trihelix transcription factor ASR3 [Phoenix dactylifera]